MRPHRYLSGRRDAKGKAVFCSNSKLMLNAHWNESKKGRCAGSKYRSVCPRIWKALVAAATTITSAASAVPAAGVTRPAGTIRRRAVVAEPGEQARTAGPVTGAIAGAGTVAAGVLAPRLAVLHPIHQQVANQRRSADRHHECRHPAGHGVLWLGRFGSEKLLRRNIVRCP